VPKLSRCRAGDPSRAHYDDEQGDATMAEDVQLIHDDDGLAVIGEPTAVERFLASVGQWASSTELDLRPLKPYLAIGADVAEKASELAENSGRWIKLTEASTALVKEHGFMESTQNPDENHLMIPGLSGIGKWLQTEQDGAPLLANPAVANTLSGILARAATQQDMADVVTYLKTIDQKVDDVLRKVDDAEVAKMDGVTEAIERACGIRDEIGTVTETLWSTVDQSFSTIAATQAYGLRQLEAIARKLEDTDVRDLAQAAALAEADVPKWLGVLAQCFRLQDAVETLELDRVLAETPLELGAYRRGLQKKKQERRRQISDHTFALLGSMDAAVTTANAKVIWHRTLCHAVIGSANHVATGIDDFHGVMRIDAEPRSWSPRRLGTGADIGSQAIQGAKDNGPQAVAVALAGLVFVKNKGQGGSSG
jgi:hypothetical protein